MTGLVDPSNCKLITYSRLLFVNCKWHRRHLNLRPADLVTLLTTQSNTAGEYNEMHYALHFRRRCTFWCLKLGFDRELQIGGCSTFSSALVVACYSYSTIRIAGYRPDASIVYVTTINVQGNAAYIGIDQSVSVTHATGLQCTEWLLPNGLQPPTAQSSSEDTVHNAGQRTAVRMLSV